VVDLTRAGERSPWSTCPAAGDRLAELVGMELSPSCLAVGAVAVPRHQCTHQFDLAGSMGGDSVFTGGVPKMHLNLSAQYDQGPWSGTIQTRYIGTARINNNWTSGVQIDNNAVPAVAYMDLRGSYKWNDNVQLYAAVDNVWDTPPPTTVGTNPSTNGGSSVNVSVYDTLGRMYHAGVRFNF
jgi:outer membrane receptor protein involved in Fe transport